MTTINCAFYGSLRRPMYNYNRIIRKFGSDSMSYIKTVSIPGYTMYAINSEYPGIKEADLNKRIVIDLFKVSKEAYNCIKEMEQLAGFYEDSINVSGEDYSLFPYGYSTEKEFRVECGDWIKFVNLEKNIKNDNSCY